MKARLRWYSEAAIRIIRVITRLNIGGPAIQAIALSDRLTARGFRTLLVHGRLGEREGDMGYLAAPDVDTYAVPSLRRPIAPLHDARALVAIVQLLRRTRPAIVHTHTAKAGAVGRLAAAIYNRTTGRRAPARIVHTYHGHVLDGYFSPRAARLFTAVERQLARVTDAIVSVSPRIKHELLHDHRIGRASQHRVIPLGFDLSRLIAIDDGARREARAALDIPVDARVVSTVGRLTPIKQHQLFLKAAARIAQREPAALFVLAGDGELREELEALSRQISIHTRTRFLGWRRDLATIYAATDVFLLTSRNEGTPVALIESLASATPAVSTDVGGVRDVIDSPSVGVVVPFGDLDALADAVCGLLGDEARRRAMGARGRDAMTARYGIDRLLDDVEALYRDLAG
jgi:glycosyltransferase involved in cell wall biosynthesis